MDDLDALAAQHFGFMTLLPGQREVMTHLISGRSAAAIFPTGGGKSLCYQLPALVLEGITLVVSPLIALMKDQIDALKARGVLAHRLDSTLTAEAYREAIGDLHSGRARLLYVAPERFNNERFRQSLKSLRIALFAVDEAHCISEWGHNFRPDYLKLASIARDCGAERILALTATAPPPVAADIARGFAIEQSCVVRTPFYRENLTLLLTPCSTAAARQHLLDGLRQRPRGATLVYVTLQKTAERVARILTEAGFPADAYHAGLGAERRAAVQERFLTAKDGIVVATIAFGMGIDKSDIRYVYHYNLPKSLENLAQEIGRAGRDGAPSTCEAHICPDDLTTLENFVFGDTPSERAVLSLVQQVVNGNEDLLLDLHALSLQHDIRPLVLRTLLTYLELDGILKGGTPLYNTYRVKPLTTSSQILGLVQGEQQEILRGIFKTMVKKRTWLSLDAEVAAKAIGSDRHRVVKELDWLVSEKHIELKAEGVRHRYRRLCQPASIEALTESLNARMQQRERAELSRIEHVLALATQDACQVRALGRYFGDTDGAPCGHCSHCLRGRAPLPPRAHAPVTPTAVQAALELQREHPKALGEARALARFLCGLSSPALSAARLASHRHFGALAGAPFGDVLSAVEEAAHRIQPAE